MSHYYNIQVLVGSLICYLLLLRDFRPYGIIFINVYCYNHCDYKALKRSCILRSNIYYSVIIALHLSLPLTGNLILD
jgi:hypothetical protein